MVKELLESIAGLIVLAILFLLFGGSYRDAVLGWFNQFSSEPLVADLRSLPISHDDFATVARNTGCNSPYSEEKKDELFRAYYLNKSMVVTGEIVTLDNGRVSLRILPSSILQDVLVRFTDPQAGYSLLKGSRITVAFRMTSAGGCFLPYGGDLGEVLR